MRVLFALTLRSLLWRRWASLGLLASAAVAFATAAVGPLWANAAEDSLLARAVLQAPVADRTVTVRTTGNDVTTGDQIPYLAYKHVKDALRLPPQLDAVFGPATQLTLATSQRQTVQRGKTRVLAGLAWRPGGCERLHLSAGRCPTTDSELTLSQRTAAVVHARVGQRITIPALGLEPVEAGTGTPFPSVYRVVGLYSVPRPGATYWTGSELFGFSPAGVALRDPSPAQGDAMFATQSLLMRLDDALVRAEARRVLDLADPRADRVDPVEAALASWDADLQSSLGTVTLQDNALSTLQSVRDERDAVRRASYLLGLQLLVLVWYVLFLMTSAASDIRSNDMALGKLRGLKARTVSLAGILEPLVLVVISAPLGLLLGLFVAKSAAHAYLPGHVDLRLDQQLAVAVLVALAGSCLAAGLGLARNVRRPVLAQLQRAGPSAAVRRLVVAEVVVITAAAAALWQVHTRADDETFTGLALLAPGLGAVAVAVLGGRVLQQLARPWARHTRHRAHVAGFLASRQIARRAGGTRTAIITTVAVSLATFAVCTWALVDRQRQAQASLEVGAASVYQVRARSTPALLTAVAGIDPRGTMLAAAVEYPSTNPSAQLLAIDARRLPAVADWPAEWGDVHEIARRLRPPTATSLTLRGRSLEVQLDASIVDSPDVVLSATLADRDGRESAATFGRIAFGVPQTLTADVRQCLGGCRIVSFTVLRQPDQIGTLIGRVTFRGLAVDGTAVDLPFAARNWRAGRVNEGLAISAPLSKLRADGSGVRMTFNDTPSQSPGIVRADVPRELPIASTTTGAFELVGREDLVQAPGLDGLTVQAAVVSRTDVLPREGAAGVLTDLEFAYRFAPDVSPRVAFQVWANDQAPSAQRLTKQLRAAGVTVLSRETQEQSATSLSRRGPALALLMLLGVAAAALALAVLAVGAGALVQGRRRAFELAALRTAGVPDSALQRAAVWEYGVQLGAGTLGGLLSGAGTALLAGLPIARLGMTGTLAPTRADLAWLALVLVAGVSLVVFAALTAACASSTLRFADPDLLRGAQQ